MKAPERETDTHIYFWDSMFSNWYPIQFDYKGHTFQNSEQAFMWEKAVFFGDREIAEQILETPNPGNNKALGRMVSDFDPEKWMDVCLDIMIEVNMAKWSLMKNDMIATGDKIIVEASPYDRIWGIGLKPQDDSVLDERNWDGLNLLGKALMKVRDNLKSVK